MVVNDEYKESGSILTWPPLDGISETVTHGPLQVRESNLAFHI